MTVTDLSEPRRTNERDPRALNFRAA